MIQQLICLNFLSPLIPLYFSPRMPALTYRLYCKQSSRSWKSLHAGEQLMKSKSKNIGNHTKNFQLEKEPLESAQVWTWQKYDSGNAAYNIQKGTETHCPTAFKELNLISGDMSELGSKSPSVQTFRWETVVLNLVEDIELEATAKLFLDSSLTETVR